MVKFKFMEGERSEGSNDIYYIDSTGKVNITEEGRKLGDALRNDPNILPLTEHRKVTHGYPPASEESTAPKIFDGAIERLLKRREIGNKDLPPEA